MDPNEALVRLRMLVEEMRAQEAAEVDPDEPGEYYRIADEAVTAFDELDGWLARGGFLPAAWARGRSA